MKSTLSQKMYVKLHKHNLTAFKIFVYFSIFVMFPYAIYYATMSADHVDVLSDAEQVWRYFVVYFTILTMVYTIIRVTKRGFR